MIFECSQCMVVVSKEVHRVGFRKGVGIKMKHIIFQSFNFSVFWLESDSSCCRNEIKSSSVSIEFTKNRQNKTKVTLKDP